MNDKQKRMINDLYHFRGMLVKDIVRLVGVGEPEVLANIKPWDEYFRELTA